jgi:hypothetical protein
MFEAAGFGGDRGTVHRGVEPVPEQIEMRTYMLDVQ